ncbi:MAG: hypothetical protein ACI8WP_000891 [Flavobacteriaceae bacterium]|jgi:hypothetical protein
MNTLEKMPDHARLWVYQSSRPFTESERNELATYLDAFVDQWKAHGQALLAKYCIEYNQFIVVAVDESFHLASGCSIDASVGLMRQLEQKFGISLLDRSQVAYLNDEDIVLKPFNTIKEAVASGEIAGDTIIFNNAVQSVSEWKNSWAVPANTSWLKRYFA